MVEQLNAGLSISMEEDVQDGKTFHEHEHEFYVEIEDFEQLKNAESVDLQEQWNLKIDKNAGNIAKGALRIRQIYTGDLNGGPNQKPTGEAQYVLTTKVNKGVGKRLEVPVPTTKDAFDLFAMLSDSGMIKHRYHFPVGELVFEVDMFLNPEGGYYPIAKIDLEVKNLSGEIPPLPIKVKSEIIGSSRSKEDQEKIREYYDKYFITKNKFLKESDPGDHEYRGDYHGGTVAK
jgi:CYTH domain-containing protein